MMKVLSFPLGQLQANCYFLIKENNCLIIDSADDASFILEELQRRRLKLIGMLATHGHFDHIMAVGEIQKSINVPLYIHKEDLFLVDRLEQTAEYFLKQKLYIIKPTSVKYLTAIEYKIQNFEFEVLKTPGHTPGSVSYYFPEDKIIFTGDTLFKEGIGRYDFSYSSKTDLKKSIQKILNLRGEIMIYSGHGDSSRVKNEQKIIDLL